MSVRSSKKKMHFTFMMKYNSLEKDIILQILYQMASTKQTRGVAKTSSANNITI